MTIDICLPFCSITRMSLSKDLLAAIKRAHREKFGSVNSRLAKAADCDNTGIGRLLAKNDLPKMETLNKLAAIAGVRVVPEEEAKGPDYAFVPRALARPAAGGGSLETTGETEGALAFRRAWLERKTPTCPERLRAMEVVDDCMEPTIHPGDIVLVDEGDAGKELREDRVYVIRRDDEIFVKRFKKATDMLIFAGDNKAREYKNVTVLPGDGDRFAVIGRVLWAGKEF